MINNNQQPQQVDKLTIKNRLSRIDLSNDKFLYLTFKSSVNGKLVVTKNTYGNIFYTNTYSYLEFEYNEVNNQANNNSFGFNFYELSLFLDKLLLTIDVVGKNVANIKNGSMNISSLNLAYTMGNKFNNANINVTFSYTNSKIFVSIGYSNPQQQKLFSFNGLSWVQYKILIEELKQIKNNWHVIQNNNTMMLMYSVNNNTNDKKNSNNIIETPKQQNAAPVINKTNYQQPNNHIEVEDPQDILPPWEEEDEINVNTTPINNNVNTVQPEVSVNIMPELDGFENDTLDGLSNSVEDDLNIDF